MSDDPTGPLDLAAPDPAPRHLWLVPEPALDASAAAPRPRTIGRLIAQTALIADSALTRRRLDDDEGQRGIGRLLGRFR